MFDTMYRLHLVIPEKDLKKLLKEIVCTEEIALVDARQWVEASLLTLRSKDYGMGKEDQHHERKPSATREEVDVVARQLETIKRLLGFSKEVDLRTTVEKSFRSVAEEVEKHYRVLTDIAEKIRLLEEAAEKLSRLEAVEVLTDLDVNFSELQELTFFSYRLGTLPHRERAKLERNEENIVGLFFWIERHHEEGLLLVVMPRVTAEEMDRILRSVDFNEIKVPGYLAGRPVDMIQKINGMMYDVHFELLSLQDRVKEQADRHGTALAVCEARLVLERRLIEAERLIVRSDHRAYLSAKIPKAAVTRMRALISKCSPETIIHLEREVN